MNLEDCWIALHTISFLQKEMLVMFRRRNESGLGLSSSNIDPEKLRRMRRMCFVL